jgi:hypothetical protein
MLKSGPFSEPPAGGAMQMSGSILSRAIGQIAFFGVGARARDRASNGESVGLSKVLIDWFRSM